MVHSTRHCKKGLDTILFSHKIVLHQCHPPSVFGPGICVVSEFIKSFVELLISSVGAGEGLAMGAEAALVNYSWKTALGKVPLPVIFVKSRFL